MKFKFSLFWLFALMAIVSFAMTFYIRTQSSLKDFLPASTLSYRNLNFEWEPYAEIIAFSADMDLADIDRWYADNFEILLHDEMEYDPGQITIYFETDRHGRSFSVCLADTSVKAAVESLDAYVGPDNLRDLLESNPRLVGVIFMEDENETFRRLKASGEL